MVETWRKIQDRLAKKVAGENWNLQDSANRALAVCLPELVGQIARVAEELASIEAAIPEDMTIHSRTFERIADSLAVLELKDFTVEVDR